jgi:SSXT protein (N-terminal region)
MKEQLASSESVLLDFQKLLELNEDIIAAIVENLQLGRLEDCVSFYSILQKNLVSLGNELDNYPPGDTDPYEDVLSFPDEIMKKDVLDDLLPHDSRVLPKPPPAPPCWRCASMNVSNLVRLYSTYSITYLRCIYIHFLLARNV